MNSVPSYLKIMNEILKPLTDDLMMNPPGILHYFFPRLMLAIRMAKTMTSESIEDLYEISKELDHEIFNNELKHILVSSGLYIYCGKGDEIKPIILGRGF